MLDGHESHAQSSFKLATRLAMGSLDTLADSQEISSNAYNCMAKRLKMVFDSRDVGLRRAKGRVVREMAASDPAVLNSAPLDVDWATPAFVSDVLRERAKFAPVCEGFLGDLTETFLNDSLLDHWNECCAVRNGMLALLLANGELFGPHVMRNLKSRRPQLSPRDLFHVKKASCSCPIHNRFFGTMVSLVEAYPDDAFLDWMSKPFDNKHDFLLFRALHEAAGKEVGEGKGKSPVCK